jgi:hypothetical protein
MADVDPSAAAETFRDAQAAEIDALTSVRSG